MQVVQRTWRAGSGWDGPLEAPGSGATVVIAFGGRVPPSVLEDLGRALPGAACIGCSTAGEIAGDEILDDGVSLAIVSFEVTTVRVSTVPVAPDAGRALGEALQGDGLAHVFVLSDGLQVNGSALVAGLREQLGDGVVVTGGLAGDGSRFGSTWVWDGRAPLEGHVVGLGLYGEALEVQHACGGGWEPFGIERTVTSSRDNVLMALDGRPALALYKEYLGDLADELPATGLLFPLALLDRHGDDMVRTILAVDEEAQSLTFAGDVPEGSRVRLMRTTLDSLVDAAAEATATVSGGGPVLALVVSCVGRRLVLADRAEDEPEAVSDQLPAGSGLLGFFSYGELSPTADGTCDLHNQTMTLTVWRESTST